MPGQPVPSRTIPIIAASMHPRPRGAAPFSWYAANVGKQPRAPGNPHGTSGLVSPCSRPTHRPRASLEDAGTSTGVGRARLRSLSFLGSLSGFPSHSPKQESHLPSLPIPRAPVLYALTPLGQVLSQHSGEAWVTVCPGHPKSNPFSLSGSGHPVCTSCALRQCCALLMPL